jgi:hypothetical protein
MLVTEEVDGSVWLAWSDFLWVAHRYGIKDEDARFKMAIEVASGPATAAAPPGRPASQRGYERELLS